MSTTRRGFLAGVGAGVVSASALLAGRGAAAGDPETRRPAPARVSRGRSDAAKALADSQLVADEAIATRAIDLAVRAGASYADARLVAWTRESIAVRDERVESLRRSREYGLALRVLVDGAWGFAAVPRVDRGGAARVARDAVKSAKLDARARVRRVELVAAPPVRGSWVSPYDVDPFELPIREKVDLLIDAASGVLRVGGVAHATASVELLREEKMFISSEGSRTHQLFLRVMPSLSATAVDRRSGRFARRDHEVQPALGGWEHVRNADLAGDAARIGDEAVRKLHAHSVEPGEYTVILAPSNLWLTIHESIGHPTELDRAMGLEANFAGTSFLAPKDAGTRVVGSELIDIWADRTQPGGLATTAWDDDGVESGRWKLIDKGRFVGWQTTREQAAWIGETASRGCSYADGYASVAFQRMPNVSLQPGSEGYTTEDLINATDAGILISGRGSWSIDHQRYNFQFGGQYFWEIKNGRLRRPLRDVAYQANTIDFWRSCDMLGGEASYRLGGSLQDGKGEPGQFNAVSHGCPPGRFRCRVLNTGGER